MKHPRLVLFMLIVLSTASAACTTAGSSTDRGGSAVGSNVNSESPTQPESPTGDTNWVISVTLLNGSVLYSDVIQLPTNDKESVAAAVNAWGRTHGRMTNTAGVYPFPSADDAQKWRRAKGDILHLDDLTRDDILSRLCVGQPTAAATDYWVISVKNDITGTHYISPPLLLSVHPYEAISAAVSNWIMATGGRGLSPDDANTRKFDNLSDAQAFVSKGAAERLDLTAETLNKYLCANEPDRSQPTPKPRSKR